MYDERRLNMTDTKYYLQGIMRLNNRIEQKKTLLDGLRKTASGLKAVEFNEKVKFTPSGEAQFARMTERIIELEYEIANDVNKYVNVQNKITNEIQRIDNVLYSSLLFKRYVQCKSFKTIAKELKYSCGYIRNAHKHALKQFEEVIKRCDIM